MSPSDIWAVGSAGVVHWDGHRWQRSQLPRGVTFRDVAAIAHEDVWAVEGGEFDAHSRPQLVHWNGSRWRVVSMSGVAPLGSELYAIDFASATDVWAVGATGLDSSASYGFGDLVVHWDGHRWKRVSSPLQDVLSGMFAQTVDITPSGEVWTANDDLSGNGPYFVRWRGPTRSITHVSNWDTDPISVSVFDIAAVSKNRVWAVGVSDDKPGEQADSPLVGYWDRTSWHLQHTPFDTLRNAPLMGISAISSTDLWAVGNHLIVHYSC